MNCKKKIFFIGLLVLFFKLSGQKIKYFEEINWGTPVYYSVEGGVKNLSPFFEGAQYSYEINNLPFFYKQIETPNGLVAESINAIKVDLIDLTTEEKEIVNLSDVSEGVNIEVFNSVVRK